MTLDMVRKEIDKRLVLELLGFILAVVFGAIAIYTEFIRDHRPKLRFDVISDASVLDIREKLGNLEIMYDGVDIQKAQKSLRVIVFRVTNEGIDDVLKGHYDEKTPFGFRVLRGTLVRAEVIGSSNNYIRDTLSIKIQSPDSAIFNPVIIEANEWFTIKSLIIHSDGTQPAIEPIGKIAGVRQIRMLDTTEVASKPSFLTQTFSGSIWVQIARFVTYFSVFIVIAAVAFGILFLSMAIRGQYRRGSNEGRPK